MGSKRGPSKGDWEEDDGEEGGKQGGVKKMLVKWVTNFPALGLFLDCMSSFLLSILQFSHCP